MKKEIKFKQDALFKIDDYIDDLREYLIERSIKFCQDDGRDIVSISDVNEAFLYYTD